MPAKTSLDFLPEAHRRRRPMSWFARIALRSVLFTTIALPLATIGRAQTAMSATASAGTIQGRVQSTSSGNYLNNARIRVVGTNTETFTNAFGEYHLGGLPPGPVTLDVFYTGLAPQRITVNVPAAGSVQQEVALAPVEQPAATKSGDTVVLSQFVVAAERETNAAEIALNEQRFSPNLKNVVSTDAFGEINQGNIGEFVKHIPGVNIEFKDGNNPSGIDIRGFGTNYTRVTMDGNSVASAAIANTQTPNRQFVLEGASINSVARIEVTKEPLSDTPANSMGGSVNLVSKSAFEYPRREINLSTYLSANSYAMDFSKQPGPGRDKQYHVLPSLTGTMILPINKKLGVVVSASNYDQYYDQVKNAPARVFTSAGATVSNPYTRSFTASFSPNEVKTTSGSMKVDWKPSEGNVLSITTSATATRQDSSSYSIGYNVGNNTPVVWGPTFTHGALVTSTSNAPSVSMGGGWQTRNALTRFIGANYHLTRGGWAVDLAATYSNSNNRIRDTDKGFFNGMSTKLRTFDTGIPGYKGGSVNIDDFNDKNMAVGSVAARDAAGNLIDTTSVANYDLGQVSGQPATNQDSVTEYRADVRRDFDLFREVPLGIKVGGSTNNLVRDLRYSSLYWMYTGPDGILNSGDEGMAGLADPNNAGTSPGFGLPGRQWGSPWLAYDVLKAHPNYFTQTPGNLGDNIKNTAARSPLLFERVSAGYAMADAKFFHNRLRLVGGVRYELTQDRGYGMRQDANAIYQRDAKGNLIVVGGKYQLLPSLTGTVGGGPEQNSLIYQRRGTYNARNYHDYFPSADAVFNITDNLLFRAAFAKTTGRPSPSDIVPTVSVSGNATFDPNATGQYPGFITSSNTSLVPWTAKNYDLSLEYYLPHNGIVSAGVFRKDVRNFFATLKQTADAALLDSIGLSQDYLGYQYTTRINGGDARIDGYELGYSQSLDFVPVVGRYFSFLANLTKLRVLGTNGQTFDLKNGGGNIPTTANAGVRFAFRRFSSGVYWNYRGKQFRDTASAYPGAKEDVLSQSTLDANVEYRLTRRFAIFAAGRNINNAITRWSLDGPGAPGWAQAENYYQNGAQYSLGIKGTF
jgi:iron complex outermembrane recepter protein